jgi:hypothetical protein
MLRQRRSINASASQQARSKNQNLLEDRTGEVFEGRTANKKARHIANQHLQKYIKTNHFNSL